MAVDVRKIGIWMVVAGGALMSVGLVADAVRHADDPTLAAREGIFDLASLPHALFFGGIALAILGLFALVAGTQLYTPGQRVTVGRRLLQVGAPMAAVVLIGGCAAFAGNSKLADPATTAAGATDAHAASHGETAPAAASTDAHSATHDETSAGSTAPAVAPKPYDPTQPIDLGGVPGVTPAEQARAENLIAVTLAYLPHFADYHTAEAAGYSSIGDALTGDEHFINPALFDDGRILDPQYPESLVYEPDRATGGKKLVAAMFMLAPNQTLDDVPDVGGALDAMAHPQQPVLHRAGPRRRAHQPDRRLPGRAEQGQRGADDPRVDHAQQVRSVRRARRCRCRPGEGGRDAPVRHRARFPRRRLSSA